MPNVISEPSTPTDLNEFAIKVSKDNERNPHKVSTHTPIGKIIVIPILVP